MPTQQQMFNQAHRDVATVNQDFLWLVQNGLTKEDLQRNIERRPSLWARFSGFLESLPSRDGDVQNSARSSLPVPCGANS